MQRSAACVLEGSLLRGMRGVNAFKLFRRSTPVLRSVPATIYLSLDKYACAMSVCAKTGVAFSLTRAAGGQYVFSAEILVRSPRKLFTFNM